MVLSPRAWPLRRRRRLGVTVGGLVLLLHHGFTPTRRLFAFRIVVWAWILDLIREPQEGSREGTGDGDNGEIFLVWVLLTELLFLRALFWRFLAQSITPGGEVRFASPLRNERTLEGWDSTPKSRGLASLGTALLLTSGICASRRLRAAPHQPHKKSWLRRTLFLGGFFLLCQRVEFHSLRTRPTRGAFFSSFYLLTGCHGSHVFRGLVWLRILLLWGGLPLPYRVTNLQIRVVYWHFVDLVWLRLYALCYSW